MGVKSPAALRGRPHAAPSLAIVVPDIRSYKGPLLDALSLHTSPGSLMPAGPDGETRAPWDISSGATLGSRPMIRAAMDLLSITPDKADSETFSRVLRSRWIAGHVGESATRALLDLWFRDNLGLNMGGKDFLRAIGAYKGMQFLISESALVDILRSWCPASKADIHLSGPTILPKP